MRPFVRLLRSYPHVPPEVVAPIDDLDPDSRIPIATIHQLLAGAIALTGDEDIGLNAAELIEVGDYGALEYAASTARNAGEALDTIGRYMRLINDALTFSTAVEGDSVAILLQSSVVLPRAAEAFEAAAFHVAVKARAPESLRFLLEVHFTHAEPADLTAYRRVFPEHARLRFEQPVCGFVFPSQALGEPVRTADPHLHELVRKHADLLLAELPVAQSFTARVRVQLTEGLALNKVSATEIARVLHVSPRTLARRLEQEGTSFKQLFDEIRRNMALRYVGDSDLAFSEIAFLLGFSQAPGFHRAFKRWTGQTPLEYRSARRG
jgi:AraC-like DNA-binding protein